MALSPTLKTAAAAVLCTAATAQAALGAGEPKNTPPFIDPPKTSQSTSYATISGTVHRAWTAIAGDAKNVQPFTRPLTQADALARYLRNRQPATVAAVGEPKNEIPFTLVARR